MAILDIYMNDYDNSVRFLLGKKGERNIVVIGLNPSTATDLKPDITITKVQCVSLSNGFDGFIMANLYPLRATNPNGLPYDGDEALLRRNIDIISEVLKKEKNPTIWCAWGSDISSRKFLKKSLKQLFVETSEFDVAWQAFGDLTKMGHPRHPSRLSYSWRFQKFNMVNYLERIMS